MRPECFGVGSHCFHWRRKMFRACFLFLLVASMASADDVFDLTTIPSTGRTVAAELVDLNGDGRTDLLQIVFRSLPPTEQRGVRVHYQAADGSIPATPSFEVLLPPGSAVYDLADVRGTPGTELILHEDNMPEDFRDTPPAGE